MNEAKGINSQNDLGPITQGIFDVFIELGNNVANSVVLGSLGNMGESLSGGTPVAEVLSNASNIDSMAVTTECINAFNAVIERYKCNNISDEELSLRVLEGIKGVVDGYKNKPDNRGCLAMFFSGFTDNPEVKYEFANNLYNALFTLRQNLIEDSNQKSVSVIEN